MSLSIRAGAAAAAVSSQPVIEAGEAAEQRGESASLSSPLGACGWSSGQPCST